eukprot:scaffold4442_cov125-Amphora_coffeaeformis.AAC.20
MQDKYMALTRRHGSDMVPTSYVGRSQVWKAHANCILIANLCLASVFFEYRRLATPSVHGKMTCSLRHKGYEARTACDIPSTGKSLPAEPLQR